MTRGDVYEVSLPKGRGHEQRGRRYAVLIQADEFLELSTVLIAPTSRRAQAATFRPEITVGEETTRVLVEQIRAVDVNRLGAFAARLAPGEQRAVDDAVALVLGLA